MEKTQIGLSLAGGGAKGAYQVGVWKALNDLSIYPDVIAGTSVGAFNGALICQDDLALAERLWRRVNKDETFQWNWVNQLGLIMGACASLGAWIRSSETRSRWSALLLATMVVAAAAVFWTVFRSAGAASAFLMLAIIVSVVGAALMAVPVLDRLGRRLLGGDPLTKLVERYVDSNRLRRRGIRLIVTIARQIPVFDPDRPSWRWSGLAPRAAERSAYVPEYRDLTQIRAEDVRSSILESAALRLGSSSNVGGVGLADAGVADNLPITPLMDAGCSVIIAVHLNHNAKDARWKLTKENELRQRIDHIRRLHCLARRGPRETLDIFHREFGNPTKIGYYMGRMLERLSGRQRPPVFPLANDWKPFTLIHIVPSRNLGGFFRGTLNFSASKANRLVDLGYQDALTVLRRELPQVE